MEKAGIPARSIYDFDNPFVSPSATEIDELADKCQSLEARISSLNENYETLKRREVELHEWRWVLREAGGFFDRVGALDSFIDGWYMSSNYPIGSRSN
jgi:V-type H+-transporting ATPase subunit a